MANLFTLAVLAVLVGGCSTQGYLDSLLQDGRRELVASSARADVCTAGDFFCDATCSKVLFCQDGVTVVVIESCVPNVTLCNAVSRQCEAGTECIAPPDLSAFTCHAIGYFPDPYDCKTYHLCGNPPAEVLKGTCEGTTAYNPLTTQCSLTDQDRVCVEKPIPKCTAAGQIGPQQENPNIYYICIKSGSALVPSLYKCPGSQVFVGTKCVNASTSTTATTDPTGTSTLTTSSSTGTDPSTGTSQSSTSDGTSTTTGGTSSTGDTSSTSDGSSSTASPTSTTALPTTTPYPCPGQGSFKDPLDCHSFYFCDATLVAIHATCQQGYYYVQGTGCKRGTCTN